MTEARTRTSKTHDANQQTLIDCVGIGLEGAPDLGDKSIQPGRIYTNRKGVRVQQIVIDGENYTVSVRKDAPRVTPTEPA